MSLTHLSLFSGIGGLDLAAEWAGIETVGQCEFANPPYMRLMKHWPDITKWRDIHDLTREDFEQRTGRRTVDIISGGFPCQPFSTAGKRRGKEDDRYLWPQMLRVIQELKPTWFIGENVAGLVSMVEPDEVIRVESGTVNRNKDFDSYEAILSRQKNMLLINILRDIERIGYEVQPFIIPACAVGAPHRRERIFIVGYSKHNGQFAKSKLRGNEEAGYKWRQEESQTARQFAGADRSVDVPSLSRCKNRSQQNVANSESFYVQGQYDRSRQGQPWGGSWWSAEPNVGRVANGIPDRVDRLKCLGNAVVPQQAYPIFKAIAELEAIIADYKE